VEGIARLNNFLLNNSTFYLMGMYYLNDGTIKRSD